MIDVVFLLIIFFLVASYFVRSEQSREVALPEAIGGQTDEVVSERRLTITVEADGTLSVAGLPLTSDDVIRRIDGLAASGDATQPDAEIRIRMDRATRFGEVRQLVENCATRNIGRIRFAVVQSADAANKSAAGGTP